MSLLQDIQAAAVDPETDATDLLRLCMILAARLKNEELRKWVIQELNGYEPSIDLPSYRIVRCGSFGTFTNGHAIRTNVQISEFRVPEEFHKYINLVYFRQGLKALSNMVEQAKEEAIKFAWNKEVALLIGKYNYPHLQCMEAFWFVPISAIAAIIDTVKTRVLDFALEIEKEDPNAGEASGKAPHIDPDHVTFLVENIIMAKSIGHLAQGESKMGEGTTFNVGEQHAGRDINQAGGDIYQAARDITISSNSSASDVLKVVEGIKNKVNESDVEEKNKKRVCKHLDHAILELKDENPDKESIADSIKQTNEILKEAKTTGETLKEIGVQIAKVATWLGGYAHSVGLI